MTYRHIHIFCAVCENGCNITKTAEVIHITQPAISQTIKELEEYYGVELFDRIGRKLVLTDAGKTLFDRSKEIDFLWEETENELRKIKTYQPLKIGATLTIGAIFLPKYVEIFKDIHPESTVNGIVGPTNVLEDKIVAHKLDFALIEGIAHNPSIITEPYLDDELTIVCRPDTGFEKEQTISVEEFQKQNILVREKKSGTRGIFESATEKAGFSVVPSWESISTRAIINAARCGLGVAVLPYRIVEKEIDSGELININVEGLDLSRKFYIARHKSKHLSSSAKEFIRVLKEHKYESC